METVNSAPIDLLDARPPALSATSDMPVVETKPDASLAEKPAAEAVPPEPEKADGEAEQSEESATSATETPGQPAAPRGVGKKIAELTRQREDEKRRADSEHEEKLRLLALLEAKKAEGVQEDAEPVKPAKADYSDPDRWDEALMSYADEKAAWTARREVNARLAEEQGRIQEAASAEGQKMAREAYKERMEKTREKYPDFDEFANSAEVKVSMPVAHAIIQSENGPDIQYYLGQHPEEAERLSAMTVRQFNPQTRTMDAVPDVARQLLELGKIVAKISTAPPLKPAISNAPKPLKPLKGGEAAVSKDPQNMSMDEYARYRKSGAKI